MNPNASSLFHFTENFNVFKLILEKGLRYSFAFESFPDSIVDDIFFYGLFQNVEKGNQYQTKGIALPMVSFCDIPLMRVGEHSARYGKYAVGISQEFLTYFYKEFINPVIYVDSPSLVNSIRQLTRAKGILSLIALSSNSEDARKIKEYFLLSPQKTPQVSNELSTKIKDIFETGVECKLAIDTILSLYKPTYGKNTNGEMQSFYNEREWRAVWPNEIESDFEWQIGCSRENFKSMKKTLNNNLDKNKNAFITIPGHWFNMVNHIIVPKESDIENIIDFILSNRKLFGYNNIKKSERYHLISKITSFERIEKDF